MLSDPLSLAGSASRLTAAPVIRVPDFSLVLLVGPTGTGKSAFAKRHFPPAMILPLSSPRDPREPISAAHMELIRERLRARQGVVLDTSNLGHASRRSLIGLAQALHAPVLAIGFRASVEQLQERLLERGDARRPGVNALRQEVQIMERVCRTLKTEGYSGAWVLEGSQPADTTVELVPLPSDQRGRGGPFDLIGDIHGCLDELLQLLEAMGYTVETAFDDIDSKPFARVTAPAGRRAVFLGDLTDRGPRSTGVLRLVMDMIARGQALAVAGNHDDKLARALQHKPIRIGSSLQGTLNQLMKEPLSFNERARDFLAALPSHLVLAGGDLVCVHAGLREDMQNRLSSCVRAFSLYGDVDGTMDKNGFPNRRDWVAGYTGPALVAYGHTVVPEVAFRNNTICLDTGCCFGGHLSALRWPERQIVQVPAATEYAHSYLLARSA